MTPADLAALHRLCFKDTRSWSKNEFEATLASKFVFLVHQTHGFALGRTIASETELLTFAVDPNFQNRGHGNHILQEFEQTSLRNGANQIFLEVAATNHSAIRLYNIRGFTESGRRSAYYRLQNNTYVDAILMRKSFE